MRIRLLLVAVLVITTGASGCRTKPSGSPFRPVEEIPPGKALVYIYRPPALGGLPYHVATGDQRIVRLHRGGYFPYFAEPGEVEFWAQTESREKISEYVEVGGIYYLKATLKAGLAFPRPRLEFVSEESALKEIRECVLLLPALGRAQ